MVAWTLIVVLSCVPSPSGENSNGEIVIESMFTSSLQPTSAKAEIRNATVQNNGVRQMCAHRHTVRLRGTRWPRSAWTGWHARNTCDEAMSVFTSTLPSLEFAHPAF